MADMPKLCSFLNTDDAPEGDTWLAFFYDARNKRLPVCFAGPTEQAVRATAAQFWLDEQAKLARKKKAPTVGSEDPGSRPFTEPRTAGEPLAAE